MVVLGFGGVFCFYLARWMVVGFVFLWGFGSLVKLSYSEICIEHGN